MDQGKPSLKPSHRPCAYCKTPRRTGFYPCTSLADRGRCVFFMRDKTETGLMQLSADEKNVLVKASVRPTAGLELTRKEQECIPNLKRLELLTVYGSWPHHPRIDLQIFKTRTDKCEALLAHLSQSTAE